jgi:hypothetical protein
VPPIKEIMKNYENSLNQGISWKEFEVVARNCPHALRFDNPVLKNDMNNSREQTGFNTVESYLDLGQILNYKYSEDDLTQMEEFRVKKNNDRFGFSVENPSDEFHRQHASH